MLDLDSAIVETVRVNSNKKPGSKDWMIRSKVFLKLNQNNVDLEAKFRFHLNDEEIQVQDTNKSTRRIIGHSGDVITNEFQLDQISNDKILPWYPNMFDYLQERNSFLKPNLYNLTVSIENRNNSKVVNKRTFRIGFREIKLIEEQLIDGRTFFFKINDLPFFARGINYIPTTLNVGNLTEQKTKFTYLLHQVKDANMNMIR